MEEFTYTHINDRQCGHNQNNGLISLKYRYQKLFKETERRVCDMMS